MDKFTIIVGSVFEVVALCVLVRLWIRKHFTIIPRILVSLILLVPFFGLLIYILIRIDLPKNPDRMDSQSDYDAFSDGGGGH